MLLQTESHPLTTGQPLSTSPLWLMGTLAVPLDLELSYERACKDMWNASADAAPQKTSPPLSGTGLKRKV